MDPAPARAVPASTLVFRDGLGDRFLLFDKTGGEPFEMLCVRPELTAVPSFEFALRERVGRLANFRHAYYGRVRRVDRVAEPDGRFAVVFDHTPGARLSDILAVAERDRLALDINAALCLIRQLVPAVAMLHQNARDVAHGALAPERIVVTPHARLVIVEYVLGSALEQLHLSHERLWKDFRVALPPSAGLPRFDQRADVTQIGMVALALVLGRPVREDEYPRRIADVLAGASETSILGEREPLSQGLRGWIARALQLDFRRSFHTAVEAQTALDELLSEETGYIAAPIALETFLARFYDTSTTTGAEQPAASATAAPRPEESLVVSGATGAPGPMTSTAPTKNEARSAAQSDAGKPSMDPERLFTPVPRPPEKSAVSGRRNRRWGRLAAAVGALALIGVAAPVGLRLYLKPTPVPPAAGGLVVESRPAGAEVVIDGRVRGNTPLKLSLPPGPHTMEVMAPGGEPRMIPLTIQTGAMASHYIELQGVTEAGQLQIRTDPAGAQVTIDGHPRGTSPIAVTDLAPGEHEVLLEHAAGSVRQRVTVAAGTTASLVVPMGAPANAPLSGWVAVSAPFEVQILEDGRLLGTNRSDRIMVAAGRHQIDIVNETLGYTETQSVQVPPGKVAALKVQLPRGTMHLNAVPWAEVWIDGQKVGETPIGNLSVPIGPHEIVFRNPQFGEQRHVTTVTLAAPARVSVDFRKRP